MIVIFLNMKNVYIRKETHNVYLDILRNSEDSLFFYYLKKKKKSFYFFLSFLLFMVRKDSYLTKPNLENIE